MRSEAILQSPLFWRVVHSVTDGSRDYVVRSLPAFFLPTRLKSFGGTLLW